MKTSGVERSSGLPSTSVPLILNGNGPLVPRALIRKWLGPGSAGISRSGVTRVWISTSRSGIVCHLPGGAAPGAYSRTGWRTMMNCRCSSSGGSPGMSTNLRSVIWISAAR